MARSLRDFLQAIFDFPDDEDVVTLPRATRSPPSSRSSSRGPSRSTSARGDDAEDRLPYSPSRLDGEFNVWFTTKPLGLGLVPSTQMYGSWEVSSVAPAPSERDEEERSPWKRLGRAGRSPSPPRSVSPSRRSQRSSGHMSPRDEALLHSDYHDEQSERSKIAVGDVIVAINFSTRQAHLDREDLAKYLRRSACPIVITLRRPALYGSFDSHSLATAMFPTSIEYRGRLTEQKSFHGRASSAQWQRNLHHELSKRGKKTASAKTTPSERFKISVPAEPQPEPTKAQSPTKQQSSGSRKSSAPCSPSRRGTVDLNEMGEFTYTFHTSPLQLSLAPSTRLYGAVEVYEPKVHAPAIQIGDVIMAVNGDSAISQWSTDDAIEHVMDLRPPTTILFRRPAAYRRFLEKYFKSDVKPLSSSSTAKAMFPDSAEYKRGGKAAELKKQVRRYSRDSASRQPEPTPPMPTGGLMIDSSNKAPLSKKQWEEISTHLESSDQFKLWTSVSSMSTSSGRQVGKPVSSAFLT
ncbi:hypothetical protein PINS_up006411 [Pythium insidiosum]|nr:hypothetical protein PINS_up006411 [Pythium insidiosum]